MSFLRTTRLVVSAMVGVAVIGGLFVTAIDANAQSRNRFCREYADDAVKQARLNDRRKCGYSGPRWSDNEKAHYGWCMIFPKNAEREREARQKEIRECRRDRRAERVGKRAACDLYADIAVQQAKANKKYDCGFRGGEWSENNRGHQRWCMRSRRSYMADEYDYRAKRLANCFEKLGDYDDDRNDRNYRRRRN